MAPRILDECPGCHRPGQVHKARGLCILCYNRAQKRGTHTRWALTPPNPPRVLAYVCGKRNEPADPIAVQLCMAGQLPAQHITTAERVQVVTTLANKGLTDAEIATRTWWAGKAGGRWAVCAFRRNHGIPAGVTRVAANRHADWWDSEEKETRVRALAGAGMTDREIGRCAGVHNATVYSYRRARGIPPGRLRRGRRRP